VLTPLSDKLFGEPFVVTFPFPFFNLPFPLAVHFVDLQFCLPWVRAHVCYFNG